MCNKAIQVNSSIKKLYLLDIVQGVINSFLAYKSIHNDKKNKGLDPLISYLPTLVVFSKCSQADASKSYPILHRKNTLKEFTISFINK